MLTVALMYLQVTRTQSLALDRPTAFDQKNYISSACELKFTENRGQWDAKAKFVARTGPVDVWVTNTGITYDWHERGESASGKPKVTGHAVSVEFIGATGKGEAEGIGQVPGISNFYIGKVAHTRVHSYNAATIKDLYPGIDLVSYFDKEEHKPRYDLVVHKGADPKQIRMRYKGAKNLKVTPQGEVKYAVAFNDKQDVSVGEQRQLAYQSGDKGVPYHFMPRQVMNTDGTVGFDVSGYRKDRDLVIDPLVWSTYFDGNAGNTFLTSIKTDSSGNVYVGGKSSSLDFPGSPHYLLDSTGTAGTEYAILAKFDSTGVSDFVSFYGGSSDTGVNKIALDRSGAMFVCGDTIATDLHTTGGFGADPTAEEAYILKLTVDGFIDYAQYIPSMRFGQTGLATAPSLFVDSSGLATVAVQAGGFAYVLPLDSEGFPRTGSSIVQAIPEQVFQVNDIDFDSAGNIFVCGSTDADLSISGGYQQLNPNDSLAGHDVVAFVSKIPAGGSAPSNATLIAGVGGNRPSGMRVDANGDVFVDGTLFADIPQHDMGGNVVPTTFPTTAGAFNTGPIQPNRTGFVSKLSNDLSQLLDSTLLSSNGTGSNEFFAVSDLSLDSNGQPLLTALTQGGAPLTWDYFSGHLVSGVVMRLKSDLSALDYSTYFGLDSTVQPATVAEDANGHLCVAGITTGSGLPTTDNPFASSFTGSFAGFISVIDTAVTPGISSLHSDRGANPAIAAGVGKTTTVTANCVLPTGTEVDFTSDHSSLVTFNGSATGQVFVQGSEHAVSVQVGTGSDVSHDTPVVITATSGTFSKKITITIKPFLRMLSLRSTSVTEGYNYFVYVYPYEVPATDQVVRITSDVPGIIPGATQVTIKGISSGGTSGPTTIFMTAPTVSADTSAIITATAQTVHPSRASAALDVLAPHVGSIVFDRPNVSTGDSANVTVSLVTPLGTDLTVDLTSSNQAVLPNVSVFIPQGMTSGTASVTSNVIFGTSPVYVRYSNMFTPNQTAGLAVVPLSAFAFLTGGSIINEGDTTMVDVQLNATTPSDQAINVISTDPTRVPNASGTISAGTMEVKVPLPTIFTALDGPRSIRLTVTSNGQKVGTVSFTLRGLITSESVDSTVQGGNTANGFIGFAETYTGTNTITVTSNNPAAYFGTPGTMSQTFNPAGQPSQSFTISTAHVTKQVIATIKISALGYPARMFHLTINP